MDQYQFSVSHAKLDGGSIIVWPSQITPAFADSTESSLAAELALESTAQQQATPMEIVSTPTTDITDQDSTSVERLEKMLSTIASTHWSADTLSVNSTSAIPVNFTVKPEDPNSDRLTIMMEPANDEVISPPQDVVPLTEMTSSLPDPIDAQLDELLNDLNETHYNLNPHNNTFDLVGFLENDDLTSFDLTKDLLGPAASGQSATCSNLHVLENAVIPASSFDEIEQQQAIESIKDTLVEGFDEAVSPPQLHLLQNMASSADEDPNHFRTASPYQPLHLQIDSGIDSLYTTSPASSIASQSSSSFSSNLSPFEPNLSPSPPTSSDPTPKAFACTQCPAVFMRRTNLNDHLSEHTGATINCPICDKVFTKRSTLRSHRSRVHSDSAVQKREMTVTPPLEPPSTSTGTASPAPPSSKVEIRCSYCAKVFDYPAALKRHLPTHTGERFRCHLCGKQYTRLWTLQVHQEKVHPGQVEMSRAKRPRKLTVS